MNPDENNKVISSLGTRFGTNYIPTDDELTKIRNMLVGPTARLAELEAAIKQKEIEYDTLLEQHGQLELDITEYRVLASPMRRLPVDVLRKIFLYCVPTLHNAILSYQREPISLTRVCSAWRAVALATPELWASLHIAVPAPFSNEQIYSRPRDRETGWYEAAAEDALRMRIRAVQECLARSGACKLDITLYDRERSEYDWPNTNYEAFLDILIPHSKRWRSMTFTTAAHSLFRVAALNAEDVPALEEIAINSPHYVHTSPGAPLPPALTWANASLLSAPRLHRVLFNDLGDNITSLPIHFQRLTHISLVETTGYNGNTSLANISTVLEMCPVLVSARLHIVNNNSHSFIPSGLSARFPSQVICPNPIDLPHLVNLTLLNSGEDLSSFFAMLNVPQLSVLEFHTRMNGSRRGTNAFIAFISRVSDTLTSLTTDSGMFFRSDFFAVLKAAQRLKTLAHKSGSSLESYNPWGDAGYSAKHFDDIFLGMLVGRQLGQGEGRFQQSIQTVELEDDDVERSGEDYSQVLLPELENLDCRPAYFTDDGLVEFLELRQHLPDGDSDTTNSSTSNIDHASYTPLRRFNVYLNRKWTRSTVYRDVEPFEEAGLVLDLSYSQAPFKDPFSLTDGIPRSGPTSPY